MALAVGDCCELITKDYGRGPIGARSNSRMALGRASDVWFPAWPAIPTATEYKQSVRVIDRKKTAGVLSSHRHHVHVEENATEETEDESITEIVVHPEPSRGDKYILDPGQMKSIAATVLPPSVRYYCWKRLYSLARDGDSFDAFLRLVKGSTRTLLVVRTSRGAVMGAYTESPWKNHQQSHGAMFYGSAQACVWRLAGNKNENNDDDGEIVTYRWTGANRYIQICDAHAKLLALGGGGIDGEFGLCVEDDFRRGSTGRCETFGNDPLCDQDQFDIVDLECWGFPTGFA